MKEAILPVVCPILLYVGIRFVNPEMEPAGIFLVICFGVAIGALINKFLFKKEKAKK